MDQSLPEDQTKVAFRLQPGPYKNFILDLYSRKIVGWEGYESESADGAAEGVRRAVLAEVWRNPSAEVADSPASKSQAHLDGGDKYLDNYFIVKLID